MKRFTGVMFLIIVAAASHPAAAAVPFEIRIAEPRIRLVSPDELAIQCRPGGKSLLGCTEFLGEQLRCNCRRDSDGWSMAGWAQLVPYVYVLRPDVERHEWKHIDDLRQQLDTYLTALAARRFPDFETCDEAAEFESIVFSLRMDMFRRSSNHRLH